jgi:phosphoglycolate phosphatase
MRYKAALFDMDGTVLDTLSDLTDAINYSLGKMGYRHDYSDKDGALFVGSGILVAFKRALALEHGTDRDKLLFIGTESERLIPGIQDYTDEAIKLKEIFGSFYAEHCDIKTAPYPGITGLLRALRASGIRTAVVSNKLDNAVQKISPLYFPGLFDVSLGETNGILRKPAPDMADEALRRLGIQKEAAVYIGDSEIDIQTAENSGLDCISVSWGFRDKAFLISHGAKAIADSAQELQEMLLVENP